MDWAGLLRIGLGQLGLSPREFWDMTPIELVLRLGISADTGPMTRSALDALVQAFPDKQEDHTDGA